MDINGNTPLHILLQSSTQWVTTTDKSAPDFGPESHYSIVILKLLLNYCKVSSFPFSAIASGKVKHSADKTLNKTTLITVCVKQVFRNFCSKIKKNQYFY